MEKGNNKKERKMKRYVGTKKGNNVRKEKNRKIRRGNNKKAVSIFSSVGRPIFFT